VGMASARLPQLPAETDPFRNCLALALALSEACQNGDALVVEAVASSGLLSRPNFEQGMLGACRRGRLNVLKVIVRHGVVDLPQFVQCFPRAFTCTGYGGHTHVAQWLLDAGMAPSPADWYELLQKACGEGHLAAAQWALRHSGGCVDADVRTNANQLFQFACANGRIHVAKWLLGLGHVDIHAHDNWAMTKAVRNGHAEVCRWLLGLDPDDAAWPAWIFPMVRVWSPVRDVWMRSVARARMP
jgi:hypothetical protein